MYKRLDEEASLVSHKGVFRKQITLFQAVALIVSATIGAGVLGVPYAVAKVGITVGIIYIVVLGALMVGLNLLVGAVVARTEGNFQMVGLAKKYLGSWGGHLMTILMYVMLLGILVVYIIGEGETLAALFGGSQFEWSVLFFVIGTFFILIGIHSIKVVDSIASIAILAIVVCIAFISVPHVEFLHFAYTDFAYLLFPYGVILFALHGAVSVPEAHTLLKKRDIDFKKAIIIAGLVITTTYILFALAVVGVTGVETTEVATIGLGNKIGKSMFLFGNLFAVLAMGTSFLMIGLALKDSLTWDYKLPRLVSGLIVCFIPFIIFLLGVRQFITAIDIVGGVFMSLESLLILLIYWRAKKLGVLEKGKYKLHHAVLLVVLLLLALSVGAVYSVVKLF